MKVNLRDIASVIRSKNSGPYELTFDIMFKTAEVFRKVADAKIFNAEDFAKLYGIKKEDIMEIVNFEPANAIKVTIVRPICSGNLGESDVYGAQQHAPLMSFSFDL